MTNSANKHERQWDEERARLQLQLNKATEEKSQMAQQLAHAENRVGQGRRQLLTQNGQLEQSVAILQVEVEKLQTQLKDTQEELNTTKRQKGVLKYRLGRAWQTSLTDLQSKIRQLRRQVRDL